MTGCPKKPNPTKKDVPFTNMADVTNSETNRRGATRAASFRRGVYCGNGGVGDNALYQHLQEMTIYL